MYRVECEGRAPRVLSAEPTPRRRMPRSPAAIIGANIRTNIAYPLCVVDHKDDGVSGCFTTSADPWCQSRRTPVDTHTDRVQRHSRPCYKLGYQHVEGRNDAPAQAGRPSRLGTAHTGRAHGRHVTSPATDEDPVVIARIQRQALTDAPSVTTFAQELIRTPSRGGIDDPEPILTIVENWLRRNKLPHRRLRTPDDAPAAVIIEIAGSRPGPAWVLDACLDTAPFGDETAWSFSPTAGDLSPHGMLRGRGATDSKTAAAMFCHLAAAVSRRIRTPIHRPARHRRTGRPQHAIRRAGYLPPGHPVTDEPRTLNHFVPQQ
jgi:hypothetical protein